MAATSILSGSSRVVYERPRQQHHHNRIRTYNWPPYQLNFWILIMSLASCSVLGVFGNFVNIQQQMELPIPWYFPYFITVAAISVLYIAGLFWLIFNRRLLPAIVMINAFIMFVLWMVGLIVVSIQLFGPNGSIQANCNTYILGHGPKGATIDTLAWLQQRNICQSWQLVFSMALIGVLFLFWIMVMAYRVFVLS